MHSGGSWGGEKEQELTRRQGVRIKYIEERKWKRVECLSPLLYRFVLNKLTTARQVCACCLFLDFLIRQWANQTCFGGLAQTTLTATIVISVFRLRLRLRPSFFFFF